MSNGNIIKDHLWTFFLSKHRVSQTEKAFLRRPRIAEKDIPREISNEYAFLRRQEKGIIPTIYLFFRFTALGSIYLVHESLAHVELYNFKVIFHLLCHATPWGWRGVIPFRKHSP